MRTTSISSKISIASCLMGIAFITMTAIPAKANPSSDHQGFFHFDHDYFREPVDWSGLYTGVHFGTMWGNFGHQADITGPGGTTNSFIGGGQIGYNWQRGSWVWGVEGDISKMDAGSKAATLDFSEDWAMTFRGRGGYAMGHIMPYATVGLAVTDTWMQTASGGDSSLRPGLAAGGGIDNKFAEKWVGRIEYLYTAVPEDTTAIGGTSVSSEADNHIIRIGLNYDF